MTTLLGDGEYQYEELAEWAQLPDGWSHREVVDVAIDKQDRVYLFDRGDHPVTIFESDGTFVGSWGEGLFTRPHGITISLDGESLFCVDDEAHAVFRYSLDGKLLQTIGTPGDGAPRQSGEPFNLPTKVAIDPRNGDLFISDGYGNARVHKFSAAGDHRFSWGEYGVEPGEFNLVHSVCTDEDGRVYIADRENHRVQIFDSQGNFLTQWNNMYRPCGLHIVGKRIYVGQLPTQLAVNADYPRIGACVTIHDRSGRQLARLGDARAGEGPGQFTAPHGLAVDSQGSIYVGEVSYTAYGRLQDPPRVVRSIRKLVKQ